MAKAQKVFWAPACQDGRPTPSLVSFLLFASLEASVTLDLPKGDITWASHLFLLLFWGLLALPCGSPAIFPHFLAPREELLLSAEKGIALASANACWSPSDALTAGITPSRPFKRAQQTPSKSAVSILLSALLLPHEILNLTLPQQEEQAPLSPVSKF